MGQAGRTTLLTCGPRVLLGQRHSKRGWGCPVNARAAKLRLQERPGGLLPPHLLLDLQDQPLLLSSSPLAVLPGAWCPSPAFSNHQHLPPPAPQER